MFLLNGHICHLFYNPEVLLASQLLQQLLLLFPIIYFLLGRRLSHAVFSHLHLPQPCHAFWDRLADFYLGEAVLQNC